MTRLVCLAVVAGWACGAFVTCGAWAEEVSSYDHRKAETEEGLYVLFCSRPLEEGSAEGDAFVGLGRGEDVAALAWDGGFGLYRKDDAPAVGAIAGEYAAGARADAATKTFAVRVDGAQYAEARALVETWSTRDDFIDEPDIEALNFCETLVKKLGMKKPFRNVLGRADPHVYFDDLRKLNRDK